MEKLKFVFAAIILLLILGCATQSSQSPKYDDMLHSLEGHHINDVIEVWGDPVKSYTAPNGNTVYVFYMADIKTSRDISYGKFGSQASEQSHIAKVDVCTTYLETNADGIIVRHRSEGIGCK